MNVFKISSVLICALVSVVKGEIEGFCSADKGDADCLNKPIVDINKVVDLTLAGWAHEKGRKHFIDESLNELKQDDPKLIEFIRENLLDAPGPGLDVEAAHLVAPSRWHHGHRPRDENFFLFSGQYGQAKELLYDLFGTDRRNGFFIEAGAFNGIDISNSLLFELRQNWTGLLVEPNGPAYDALKTIKRKAYGFNHCFSTTKHPEIVEFDAHGVLGGIVNSEDEDKKLPGGGLKADQLRQIQKVQCFPFYSVLMALGNPVVDYMTLDIEGAELQVLETIPWKKVNIRVLDIEMEHVGEVFDGSQKDVSDLLYRKGYVLWSEIGVDSIFIKKDFYEEVAKELSEKYNKI